VSPFDRGFVLQPTYRLKSGRPVVHIWGRLEGGQTFQLEDERAKPYFYVRTEHAQEARRLGARLLFETSRCNFEGHKVSRVEVDIPSQTPPLRDRLQRAGFPTYEADIPFATRYLIDHGVRGSLAIAGPWKAGHAVDRIYRNPEVEPCDWSPGLKVASIDIETDYRSNHILSVAIYGEGAEEVILVAHHDRALPAHCRAVADERELLIALARRIREIDPDVLTGWSVAGFDLRLLCQRASDLEVRFQLGRGRGNTRFNRARGAFGATRAAIPGRVVLDGPELIRGAFIRFERQSLDFVASRVLGEGKTVTGSNRGAEILRMYEHDLERFCEYNLTDARLALQILQRLELVELAVARSRLTGMPIDRVASSIAAFDFLYLMKLRERELVAPTTRSDTTPIQSFGGGHVFRPQSGLYRGVAVLDFKSLYPSLIRTFEIDPVGYVDQSKADGDFIVAPNGAAFLRQRGVSTAILDQLFPQRERAKDRGNKVESTAIKILMNSFYGVLGTPHCRFYNPQIAEAITSFGRSILVWSRDRIVSWGYDVLYGDTDSLFVAFGIEDSHEAERQGRALAVRLNRSLEHFIRDTWRVQSRLEVRFEKVYLRLFLQPVRGGRSGARKRYAGLVATEQENEVELVGLEAVRRDWTELARSTQKELYRRLFHDEPIEDYLRGVIRELLRGDRDHQLVYRKVLRKALEEYTSTTPPHVAAARKMRSKPGRYIEYVITRSGPEPASEQVSALDYQHYLDKQLEPISQPILSHLGIEFSSISGDDRQLELFS